MSFVNWLSERIYDEEEQEILMMNDAPIRLGRIFNPIQVDVNLWISIQASCLHRSRPKSSQVKPEDVTHWEVLIFGPNNIYKVSEILPHFRSLAEIEWHHLVVYSYVPTDLVNELFTALMFENRITA